MSIWDLFKKSNKKLNLPDTLDNISRNTERHDTADYDSIYEPVLFSAHPNFDKAIGTREDFTYDRYYVRHEYYEMISLLNHLCTLSKALCSDKTKKAKQFFEKKEELENLLPKTKEYSFKMFDYELERGVYDSRIGDITCDFLERSFRDEFRNALELKTPGGRVNRIEHWFDVMKYYRNYMPEKAISKLDDIYYQWHCKFKPLAEKGENI